MPDEVKNAFAGETFLLYKYKKNEEYNEI